VKFVSLFSGIEAASHAWNPLGWKALAFAEIEPFPSAVLTHHYPSVPNHGDVNKFDWSVYKDKCDVLIGGSPCQSFSLAGLRGGLSDERGNLALSYCRITHAINPRFSVYENVPGLLSDKDNAFGCFLAGLVGETDELRLPAYFGKRWPDAGVVTGPERTAAWRILDAKFWGVAQRRRRVFVVSCRGSRNWRCAAALFPVAQSVPWDFATDREPGQRIAAGLTRGADSGVNGGYAGRRREDDSNIVAACLNSGGNNGGFRTEPGEHLIPSWNDASSRVAPTLDCSYGDKYGCDDQHINSGGACLSSLPEVSLCLNAGAMGRYDNETETMVPTIGGCFSSEKVYSIQHTQIGRNDSNRPQGKGYQEGIGFTMDTCGTDAIASNKRGVRRLLPIECEKLMGFDPGYTAIPFNGKPASDSVRYRALGNSIVTTVLRWLGKRIEIADSLT
jgi:DNA (cytosine-5)-methyltransferase 1